MYVFVSVYGLVWRELAVRADWGASRQSYVTTVCKLWGFERSAWALEAEAGKEAWRRGKARTQVSKRKREVAAEEAEEAREGTDEAELDAGRTQRPRVGGLIVALLGAAGGGERRAELFC